MSVTLIIVVIVIGVALFALIKKDRENSYQTVTTCAPAPYKLSE